MRSATRWQILIPVLLAALLRFAHLYSLSLRDPLFRIPVVDAWFHASEAQRMLATGWLLPGTGSFYKGPLFSYFLALIFTVVGPQLGIVAGKLIDAAFGVISVWLIARLGERLGGQRAAWIAGIAAALYGPFIYFDTTLLQPALLDMLLLFAAERWLRVDEPGEGRRSPFIAGLLFGLVAITRAEGVLIVIGLAGWSWYRRAATPGRAWQRRAGWLLAGAALVIAPIGWRNAVLEHDPVLISHNGGINLFMGNDAAFEQASGNWHPDLTWMRLDSAPKQLGLTRGADHQRFFLQQSWRRLMNEPLSAAAVLAQKTALLFTGYEISNNQRIYELAQVSPALRPLLWSSDWFCFPSGIVIPLLVSGLILFWPRRDRAEALVLMAMVWSLTAVIFFNTARYRVPAVALLIPLAAVGWGSLAGVERPSRGRLISAAAAALALLLVGSLTIPKNPTLPPSTTLLLADAADQDGRTSDTLALKERAFREEPDNPFARIRYADALRVSQQCGTALPIYRSVSDDERLARDWRNAALRSAARCLVQDHRYPEARQAFEQFLASDPDHPTTGSRHDFWLEGTPPLIACEIRLDLADLLLAMREIDQAIAVAQRVVDDCAASPVWSERGRKALERYRGIARSAVR